MKRRLILFLLVGALPALQGVATAQDAQLRPPDVRYEPSTPEQVQAMLKLAKVTSKDKVYDLGCGDGRIVIMAAKKFGARAVGIDIDPQRIRESVANAQKAGVLNRVEFRAEDLFTADIHDATVVTLFLYDWINLKLRPKLWTELRPGTRIVSHYHDMGEWKPEKTITVGGHKIYLWTIPAKPPVVGDGTDK